MPQDLPGSYYDAEKNRYLPNKGPVPGSRSTAAAAAASSSAQKLNQLHWVFCIWAQVHVFLSDFFTCFNLEANKCKLTKVRTSKRLQARELDGNVIASSKGRCNFKEEFQKAQASHPVVWKYQGTNKRGDGALEG